MDTVKSLRKKGISPSGEIPSCPHNALLEILSRNHARVVPDGFLWDYSRNEILMWLSLV
jgi:hypothetical protein